MQLDLFAPRTRRDDPSTSVDAARAVAKGTHDLETAIVTAVAADALIDEEIIDRITAAHGDRWLPGTIVSARGRCVDAGLLEWTGDIRSNRRGRQMREWRRP